MMHSRTRKKPRVLEFRTLAEDNKGKEGQTMHMTILSQETANSLDCKTKLSWGQECEAGWQCLFLFFPLVSPE